MPFDEAQEKGRGHRERQVPADRERRGGPEIGDGRGEVQLERVPDHDPEVLGQAALPRVLLHASGEPRVHFDREHPDPGGE